MAQEGPKNETPTSNGFDKVFSHVTVGTTAAAASTAGAAAGRYLTNLYAPSVAEAMSEAVKNAVKNEGEKIAQEVFEKVGLNCLPLQGLMDAQIAQVAHQAGEQAYDTTINNVTYAGGAIGGATAALGTIVLMEAANLLVYAYEKCTQNKNQEVNLIAEPENDFYDIQEDKVVSLSNK